jgi:3-hydroxybutyryl-CoA dehydrogenase
MWASGAVAEDAFYRVPLNKLEVIKGEETAEDTINLGLDFCKSIDKEPVKVIDCVGFIVNRILHALDNEAMRLYEEGIASPEDIDKACKQFLQL